MTLPDRPAIIRLATAAETAQQPAPHMKPPPFLHNTGQRGEFILPLNIPSATGGTEDKYDDFTFDAVAWTLTAHEARPGHELQFDSMVEHGISLARALYAFNSTNAEGWGLYSEYLMQPYMPPEGQLMTLQLRLLRAARAFLDPELQAGKIDPEDAYEVLQTDVVLSPRVCDGGGRAVHVPRAGAGQQLFLRVHAAARAAQARPRRRWARSSIRRSSTTSFWRRACCRRISCARR